MDISRRTMLKMAGGSAISLGFPGKIIAILEDGTLVVQDHRVPADKNLSAEWKRGLVQRGDKESWSGDALNSIGMPVGGIAAGQLYLCGDGTLGCWELFNRHTYQDEGPYSYAFRPIPKPVSFGFFIVTNGNRRSLDKAGFSQVEFKGEYPIATVTYRDAASPVRATMRAFSPFIPLNSKDSSLPATVFEITVENVSQKTVNLGLVGFLENACARSGEMLPEGRKRHTVATGQMGLTCMTHHVDPSDGGLRTERSTPRSEIVIADFEGDTYGNWKVEGEAFGAGPAHGALPKQQPVTGYVGGGFVDSFHNGDRSTGRLISPEFKIERDFINFKIGGGNQPGKACINLVIDGKIARTSTGLNDEELLWEAWDVYDLAGQTASVEIVDDATGGWGHINIDQIVQADRMASKSDLIRRHGDPNIDTGSISLALLGEGVADHKDAYPIGERYIGEVSADNVSLPPEGTHTFKYALTWNFPNHPKGRNYANAFRDAESVARYVFENYQRLRRDTTLWRDTYYDSTLPYWLLDRLHMTAGNLATGVTEWWKTGHFWCWEGVVCCDGTCTHVWNYEHSLARLFPELERNIRAETDFRVGFDDATGLVGMRSDREYAADGQCGTILKAYREHQVSPDDRFLKQNWSKIKMAVEFLLKHDGKDQGLIEDGQPNTYDIDFFGANTFVGSLYLGALRAGEEMAQEVGDTAFAERCNRVFQNGRDATMRRLWNGEYFIQEVDESKYRQYQYGPGCLSDQLFGQGWAHQVNLGYLYPKDEVVKGLQSVWKYNWAPDVAGQNKRWPPQRPFALPGEAGLFTCTWPIGGREKEPVLYRDEVWTGIEYQVAGHMVWEGMVEEGLSICRGIHERYHPTKRNPYNEVECSDHYARALASWGVYLALSGFQYHGPAQRIGFAPRLNPENFKAAFTAAEGWGTFSQKVDNGIHRARISLKWGQLAIKELVLETDLTGEVLVSMGGRKLAAQLNRDGKTISIRLEKPVVLHPPMSIDVRIS